MYPTSDKPSSPTPLIPINQNEIKPQNLIFSYQITEFAGTVKIEQIETGFSLSMKTEKSGLTLNITSFCLNASTGIEKRSRYLYDSAIIEIALEGLILLFTQANQHNTLELFFMLPEAEAVHLICFEGFLGTCKSILTNEGKKITFTLYNVPEAQGILLAKTEFIKSRVKQELWKSQRADIYVKYYLHNHPKGTKLRVEEAKTPAAPASSNVIDFPLPA